MLVNQVVMIVFGFMNLVKRVIGMITISAGKVEQGILDSNGAMLVQNPICDVQGLMSQVTLVTGVTITCVFLIRRRFSYPGLLQAKQVGRTVLNGMSLLTHILGRIITYVLLCRCQVPYLAALQAPNHH